MNQLELDRMRLTLNPPLGVSAELGRVIKVNVGGAPIQIRKDDRYKDGNLQFVDGVLRGNSKTVETVRITPPQLGNHKE